MDADIMFNGNMLEMYRSAYEVQVREIISRPLNKSCDLDSPLTWNLKKCVDQLPQVLSGTALLYRSDLIPKYVPMSMLRYESSSLMMVPKSHSAMYGEKLFQASALMLWNKLPNHIKLGASKEICHKALKTHLFKLAYRGYRGDVYSKFTFIKSTQESLKLLSRIFNSMIQHTPQLPREYTTYAAAIIGA